MRQPIAGQSANRYPPEKPKFKAPLLLVHGLWTGPWCWQNWANHFCNLGWDCVAVDLRRRCPDDLIETVRNVTFKDCVRNLEEVILSFSTPPVVVAMNLGALMALKAAVKNKLTALVLVSPSVPNNFDAARSRLRRLLWLKYRFVIFLRRAVHIGDKDFRNSFLSPLPELLQIAISKQRVPEPSPLVREFLKPRVKLDSGALDCSLLVLAGTEDKLTPAPTSNKIAHWLSGEFRQYPGRGHWLIEDGGEAIVRDIHRWIIQQHGEKILLAELS